MIKKMRAVGLKQVDYEASGTVSMDFALKYTPKEGDVIKAFLLDETTKAPLCKQSIIQ